MGEQAASQAKNPYQDNRHSIRHSRKNNLTAGSRQQLGQGGVCALQRILGSCRNRSFACYGGLADPATSEMRFSCEG